jgi:voltage-gated hydrogen channel 1
LLHGTIEEAGSLIVVGRLWRVFKIIEEFSSGADDQIEGLMERIEILEKENNELKGGGKSSGNGSTSYGTTE